MFNAILEDEKEKKNIDREPKWYIKLSNAVLGFP